jgi:NAD(P)-dependent dehydrogenase (short-subunit alcohol dehydrogenase family)
MTNKRTVVVTGGTSGIGLACVRILAARGYDVIFCGRNSEMGSAIATELSGVSFVPVDVRSPHDIAQFCKFALEAGAGNIHGLINNAGQSKRVAFDQTTVDDWDTLFEVNARSAFLMVRHLLDGLRAAQGSVVTISSVAGYRGEEGLSLYAATKAALIGLTQSLALELGHHVRFNAICPGQIATRMMEKVISDSKAVESTVNRIPVGRLGTPTDVAEMAEWLISDKSTFVNGSIFVIDGGESAGIRKID